MEPSPSPRTEAAPLYGRARELDELRDASVAAFGGRAQVVLLVGEPGIGKTRLADTFATEAARAGALVAWGRAWEAGGAPPFWPWTEALRSLCAGFSDEELLDAGGGRWPVLGQLLPEVRSRWPHGPEPPAVDPEAARFRLFDAVSTLLSGLCRDRAIVLVLDDLHAADVGSLMLLHFVARSVRSGRMLIVGTHRDAEARLSPASGEALARVAREGRWVKLARLDREVITRWIAAAGMAADDALVDKLWSTTEGNPLFVVESLRLLRAREHGELGGDFSASVRDVILRRLGTTSVGTRALLEAGAILGRRFDVAHAAAIAGVDLVRARDLVSEAVRADVLTDLGADRAEFTHVLLREVLYGELTAEARAQAHATAARIFMPRDRDPGSDPADDALSELVHHSFAAHPVVPSAEAIGWARRAAARAMQALAFDDAAQALERAREVMPRGRAHDRERCDLLLELASAQAGAGRATAVHDSSRAAAEIARRLDDPARLARAALAFGRVFAIAVVDAELVGLLEEALRALPETDDPLRARLLARLASALQPARDPEQPMSIARSAIDIARRVAEPSERLDVLVAGGSALAYFADPRERVALDEDLIALADRLQDRARGLRGRLRLAYDLVELGDVVAADRSIEDYDRLSRRLDLPSLRWHAPILRAMRAMMNGRFAEAEAQAQEAAAIAKRIDDANAPMTLAMQSLARASAAARDPDFAALGPPVIDWLSRLADPWHAPAFAASMHARAGRLEAARASLAVIESDFEAMTGRLSLVWVAEACVAVDARALGAAVLERLVPLAERVHCWSMLAMVAERPVTHALGILATQQGRLDDAIAWLHDAHSRCAAMQAAPHRALVELDLAHALLQRGSAADRERARRLVDAAAETAALLPLPGLQPRIEALAREHGGATDPRAPAVAADIPQVPAFTMTREGDVWSIAGASTFRLKDSRGLQILARLVAEPGRELHVVDLMAPPGETGLFTDSGDVLDASAITAYRRRLETLREAEREAEAWNDAARAERAREEIDALAGELARGVGLGGRARKAGSSAEKARINVRQRLRDAIAKIAEHDPALGRHLRWAVRTGTFCAYDPAGR